MHCLDCGYDLRGLPKNRCPECGREFDPEDCRTYVDGDSLFKSNPLWSALIAAGASLGGILGLVFLLNPSWHNAWSVVLVVCMFGGWLIAAQSASPSVNYLKCSYCPKRGAAVVALIVNIIALSPLMIGIILLLLELAWP